MRKRRKKIIGFWIIIGIVFGGMIANAAEAEHPHTSILIVSLDGTKTVHGVSIRIGYDAERVAMTEVVASGNGEGAMVMQDGKKSPVVVGLIHAEGFPAGEAMRLTFIVKKGVPDLSIYSIEEFKITGPKGELLPGVHPHLQLVQTQ
jgi:hypothetical protein